MADFVQTMKDWKRMCNAMGQENEYTACDKCDLRDFGCPAIYEKECDSADWKHVENVVAKWAAEHPEPVYPTWYEYLFNVTRGENKWPVDDHEFCQWLNTTRIDDDTAQKLGIEPKEG